jgi:hypothetical protein
MWSNAFQLFSSAKTNDRLGDLKNKSICSRHKFISSFLPVTVMVTNTLIVMKPEICLADNDPFQEQAAVQVTATGEIKKLFNEGRALEQQGNIAAAQRIYGKITKLAPRVS